MFVSQVSNPLQLCFLLQVFILFFVHNFLKPFLTVLHHLEFRTIASPGSYDGKILGSKYFQNTPLELFLSSGNTENPPELAVGSNMCTMLVVNVDSEILRNSAIVCIFVTLGNQLKNCDRSSHKSL